MKQVSIIFFILIAALTAHAKHGKSTYKVPEGMVKGGAFIDLFLPVPIHEGLESDVWGASNVIPRDKHNGIEDHKWSYWGGDVITGEDGKNHMFVARWLESGPKGHWESRNSEVVHAISDKPTGQFKVRDVIGKGHNPEIYQAKDGTYVIYVLDKKPSGYNWYVSKSLNGPWKRRPFKLDLKGLEKVRPSNYTFATRPDGGILMVTRGGKVFISEDGLSPFVVANPDRIYPEIKEARLEDPVVWRDEVQYHLIVNDFYGRTAFYLRSGDGIKWVWDDGIAYDPNVVVLEDGTKVSWYKLERPKVRQDKYGRATHMYFAAIDVEKDKDLRNDNYSSKNSAVPLLVGRRMKILNMGNEVEVKVLAEENFDPQKELNIRSSRFGSPKEVNFGRGSKVLRSEKSGKNLLLYFSNEECKLTKEDFVGKLIGRDSNGNLLYGYASLEY